MANLIGGTDAFPGKNNILTGTDDRDFIFGDPFTTGAPVPQQLGVLDTGKGGNDTLRGRDSLFGDAWVITGTGRGGNDTLEGGVGSDLLFATPVACPARGRRGQRHPRGRRRFLVRRGGGGRRGRVRVRAGQRPRHDPRLRARQGPARRSRLRRSEPRRPDHRGPGSAWAASSTSTGRRWTMRATRSRCSTSPTSSAATSCSPERRWAAGRARSATRSWARSSRPRRRRSCGKPPCWSYAPWCAHRMRRVNTDGAVGILRRAYHHANGRETRNARTVLSSCPAPRPSDVLLTTSWA